MDSSLMTALTPDLDVDASASAPSPSPAAAPAPETTPTPITGDLTPPADTTSALPLQNLQPAAGPPNPKLRSVLFNHIKGLAIGMALDGIPGAVVGAVDPQGMQRQANMQAQAAQAKITFANAQAAHEVAMAHQADVEYQALPEKLQQEAEGRGLDNIAKAKQAGYLPIASIPLDQGTSQNAANAKAALDDVKSRFGQVPSGLLYIHTGNVMTVMKLQDPNAVLPTINQTLRAQGQPELSQDQFSALAPQDRDNLARLALTFTSPVDTHGEISQDALNMANARLLNVKAQPAFNGQDQIVSQLQATVDHYQSVLDSGAGAAAIRAGKAKGAEAAAAQPGTTAAQVANINATAGPEANAAGLKAGAEAKAQYPYQLALEKAKQGGSPVYAFDPQQKSTILTTRDDAISRNLQAVRNVTQPEIEKDTQIARQLGDAQMNVSAYRVSSQQMDNLSAADKILVGRIIGTDDFKAHFLGAEIPVDWLNKLEQSGNWNKLPEAAKDAVVGYIGARGSIIAYAKAISGSGRLTESQLQTELKNLPDPTVPGDIREKQFDRFQRNIDQAASGIPRIPGIELPSDIRQKIEGPANEARSAAMAQSGQYPASNKPSAAYGRSRFQIGDIANVNGQLKKVTRVYPNGSFDAQ